MAKYVIRNAPGVKYQTLDRQKAENRLEEIRKNYPQAKLPYVPENR